MPPVTETLKAAETRLRAMPLDQLLSAGLETNQLLKTLDERKKLINTILLDKLGEIGFTPGMSYVREADGVSARIQVKAGVDRIDGTKLIAKGVAMDVIEFATVKGQPSAPFLVIAEPKKKDDKGKDAVEE